MRLTSHILYCTTHQSQTLKFVMTKSVLNTVSKRNYSKIQKVCLSFGVGRRTGRMRSLMLIVDFCVVDVVTLMSESAASEDPSSLFPASESPACLVNLDCLFFSKYSIDVFRLGFCSELFFYRWQQYFLIPKKHFVFSISILLPSTNVNCLFLSRKFGFS